MTDHIMKKAIAFTLGITMALCMTAAPETGGSEVFYTAYAETCEISGCKFTYELETKGDISKVIITGVEDHGEVVEVPSAVTHEGNEYPVEKIGDRFLRYDETVKTVIFPETVKSIGSDVLIRSSVENIVLPDDIETIGLEFASECKNIKSVKYSGKKLTDVNYFHFRNSDISCLKNEKGATCLGNWLIKYEGTPDSTTIRPADLGSGGVKIENICDNVFADRSDITNLDLEGIKRIGDSSFNNCAALRTLLNCDDLIYIGAYAFEDCKDLQNILDADNVETLNDGALSGTKWYDDEKKKGLVRVGRVLVYYRTDSDTIDITKGDLARLKIVQSGAFSECTNADTFKCPSGCAVEPGCFYVYHDQKGKNESINDPIPKIPTYKIKNIYLDDKKLEFKKERPLMDKWVADNYSALAGTEWLRINAEAKVRVIFEQMDLPFYGVNNDKKGTLSKTEEFYAVLKIHDYISTYAYDSSGGVTFPVFLSMYDDKRGLTCSSYAELHDFLLECAGVDSMLLSNSECHAWNEFKIGDEWFEADAGWDAQSGHGYGWFALSTEKILKNDSVYHFCRIASSWHRRSDGLSHLNAGRTLGDINGDNDRDKDDASLLWAYIKGESKTIDKKAGDMNFDGKVDVSDAVLLDHMVNAKAVNPYKVPDDGLAPGFKVFYLNGEDYKNITYAFTDRDGYITLPEQSFKGPEGKVMRYDIGKVGERVKIHGPCTVIRTQWVDPSELEDILGDVNGDKTIDIEDAVSIIQHINGLTPLTNEQEKRADVSKDGAVDIDDAVTIIGCINGNLTF